MTAPRALAVHLLASFVLVALAYKPQTNDLGLWWLDDPSGSARYWDISLVDPRYRSLTTRVITGGVDQTVRVSLRR